jgi:RNA polymerase sigma-70 factor (ECF subfamily)
VRLVRYAYAMTGDLAAGQDLAQEAYTRARRRWRTVVDHPAPEAWMRLTISRLANDRWRKMSGWRAVMHRTGPPAPVAAPSEDAVMLAVALRRLPTNYRQALSLHYLFDMSVDQIAAETGSPVGTVKSWLHRGRAELAAVLTEAPLAASPKGRVLEVTDVE